GATTLGRDKLVFADGAVLTHNARTALTADLNAALSAVTGFDLNTKTPFLEQTATGSVSLSGTAEEGGTLSAVTSGITDPDGTPLTFSYQWQVADTANGSYTSINGATASSYAIASDQSQVGKFLRVVVTATNDGTANGTSFVSAPSQAVANVNDAAIGTIAVVGFAEEGGVLTADARSVVDPDGTALELTYQWQIADTVNGPYTNINAATTYKYVIAADQTQVGKFLRVVVKATNDGVTGGTTLTSAATGAIANLDDPGTLAAISGTPRVDQLLTAGALTDPDGVVNGSIAYQWKADDLAINGATASSFLLTADQLGKLITVEASYADTHGSNRRASSIASSAVVAVSDQLGSVTAITGTPTQAQVLTAGTLNDPDGGISGITYQWKANGIDITGATGRTFTLTQQQVGKVMTVEVGYIDSLGPGKRVSSAATGAVVDVPEEATGLAGIAGDAIEGGILTALPHAIVDPDGTVLTYLYQWRINDPSVSGGYIDIPGATAAAYNIPTDQSHVGRFLQVVVTATNDGTPDGTAIASLPTAAVRDINSPATGSVDLLGVAKEAGTLTALVSGITDPDGTALTFSYQWQVADTANGSYTHINGATASSYNIAADQSQVGKFLRVVVTATNDGTASGTSFVSAPSQAVANVNDAPMPSMAISAQMATVQSPLSFSIPANAFQDEDNDTLIYSAVLQSGAALSSMGLSMSASGVLSGTPTTTGNHTLLVKATDPSGLSATSKLDLIINSVSDRSASGAVSLSGVAQEGGTLTANVNTLTDPDGAIVRWRYNWQENVNGAWQDLDRQSANSLQIPTDQSLVGKTVRVRVMTLDALGGGTQMVSNALTIQDTNDAASGSVILSGAAQEGGALTAHTDGITDPDGTTLTFNHQWQIADTFNGPYVNIAAATGSTYNMASDQSQVGKYLRVVVTASNDGTSRGSTFISNPSAVVVNTNDPVIGSIALSGSAQEGGTLTANTSGMTDPDGMPLTFNYQWQMADAMDGTYTSIANATAKDLRIPGDQSFVGKYVRVLATPIYFDAKVGNAMASQISQQIANVNDPAAGLVEIKGNAIVGATLRAATERISDADGTTLQLSYQWQISDTSNGLYTNIASAQQSSYTIASDQVNKYFRVVATAINDGTTHGTSFTSAPTVQIKTTNNIATQLLKDIGIFSADSTDGLFYFSTNGGSTWSEFSTVDANSVLVLRDEANTRLYFKPNANYSGSQSGEITIRSWYKWAGVGPNGGIALSGTKVDGTTSVANTAFSKTAETIRIPAGTSSPPVGAVGVLLGEVSKAGVTDFDGGVTIDGFGNEGEAVVANVSNLTDPDGTTLTYAYRWQMSHTETGPYVDIPGATAKTFTSSSKQIEIGRFVRVVATAVNDGSASGTDFISWPLQFSKASGGVTIPHAALIRGEAIEGGTLTAYATRDVNTVYEEADAPFRFQWQIADSLHGVFRNIEGANQRQWQIPADQSTIGKYIKVMVYPNTADGGLYAASSEGAVMVRNANDAAMGDIQLEGLARQGALLRVVTSNISDPDGTALRLSYQWQVSDTPSGPFVDILGATSDSYVLSSDTSQLGKYFQAVVVAENDGTAKGTRFVALSGPVAASSVMSGNSNGVNEAPVSVQAYQASYSLKVGSEIRAFLGNDFSDPDWGDVLTVQIQSGSLPPGLSLQGNGVLSGTPVQPGIYDFTLRAVDLDGLIHQHSYQLRVTDAAAPVFFSSGQVSVAERTITTVYVPGVSDNSPGLSFGFGGGADDDLFAVDRTTGALRFVTAPDFEQPRSASGSNLYEVRIRATDVDGNTTDHDIAIEVTDVLDSRSDVRALFDIAIAAGTGDPNADSNAYQIQSAALHALRDPVDRTGFANQKDSSKVLASWVDAVTGTDIVSQQEYQAGFSVTGKAQAGLQSSIRFLLDNDRTSGQAGVGAMTLVLGQNDVNADGTTDVVASYDNASGEWNLVFTAASAALRPATHNVWSSGVHQIAVDFNGDGLVNANESDRLFLVASGTALNTHTGLESQNFSVHDRLSNHVFIYYYGDPDGANGVNYQATGTSRLVSSIPAQFWEFHVGFNDWGYPVGTDFAALAADHVLQKSNTSRLPSQAEGAALYAANFGRNTPGSEWLFNPSTEAQLVGPVQTLRHYGSSAVVAADNVYRGWGNAFMTAMPSPFSSTSYVDLALGQLFDSQTTRYSVVL
ncbi:putative Ig domain-containing protein, partial [Limnohabitans sp. JUR4]|nr:putative Ig domain-containing protein [Limnohabitans radicicola]